MSNRETEQGQELAKLKTMLENVASNIGTALSRLDKSPVKAIAAALDQVETAKARLDTAENRLRALL